jgi:hypothetical protein
MTALMVVNIQSGGSVPRGPGESPIQVIADTRVPRITAVSAASSAERMTSPRAVFTSAGTPVHYTDSSPFGPPSDGMGWLFRGPVEVFMENALAVLTLNVVVDGVSGGIVAVFTDPAETWVLPTDPPRNPEVSTAMDGWVMGASIPDSMKSTAVEAVAEAWRKFGLDPRAVGQVVARPRWISARFPARRVNGEIVPIRPTEKVWIVQVCGTELNTTEAGDRVTYQTGKIMQFQDGSLKYMRGVYVP